MACGLVGIAGEVRAQAGAGEREVMLSEVLAFADENAPATQVAIRRRRYGDAARAGADSALRYDPTIALGIGPRLSGTSERGVDFYVSLGLPVEVAGERGLRLDVASRIEERLDAETTATRWEIRQDVTRAYRAAVLACESVAVAERIVEFAEEMLGTTRRRLAVGDATAIEVRVAEIDAARAREAELSAEQGLRTARLSLAEASGWPIEAPPNVRCGLEAPRSVPTLAAVLQAAAERHPALRARRAAIAEAHARVELADREAWPAPVFGVQIAREGAARESDASYIVLGTLAVTLPIWQRNQEERARARVDEEVARVEESGSGRALRVRIARAHAELSFATQRVALFASSVAPSLEDSLALLRRGFDAGELPLLTVAVARERFLDAQRDALDSYADYYRALADLELAMGVELPTAVGAPTAGGVP